MEHWIAISLSMAAAGIALAFLALPKAFPRWSRGRHKKILAAGVLVFAVFTLLASLFALHDVPPEKRADVVSAPIHGEDSPHNESTPASVGNEASGKQSQLSDAPGAAGDTHLPLVHSDLGRMARTSSAPATQTSRGDAPPAQPNTSSTARINALAGYLRQGEALSALGFSQLQSEYPLWTSRVAAHLRADYDDGLALDFERGSWVGLRISRYPDPKENELRDTLSWKRLYLFEMMTQLRTGAKLNPNPNRDARF